MKYRSILTNTVAVLLPSVALFAALHSQAATYVWDADTVTANGQDGTGGAVWQLGVGNWYDSTTPAQNQSWANGNDAVFGAGSGTAAGTITLGSAITANSLTFNTTASGTYTIAGSAANPLTLTTGNITTTANGTISAVLAGNAGLTQTGAGTLTLSGTTANTYAGTTTINGNGNSSTLLGGVVLSKSDGVTAIAGDIVVNTGGSLTLAANEQIADTASLTIAGGSANFGGKNETLKNLTLTSGTYLTGNGTNVTSAVTLTGALTVSGGSFTINSGATLSAQSANLSATTIVLGGNTLTKLVVGSGGLTLSGQTLQLNVAAGANQVVLNGDLTSSGTTAIKTDITPTTGLNELVIGGGDRIFNITGGTTTVSVVLSGTATSLTKTGTGTLTLSGTQANTYTGPVTVTAGSLTLAKSAGVTAVSGNILVNGGTLTLGAANQIADSSALTLSSGTINFAGFAETVGSVNMSGGSLNTGTGTGPITIAGALQISGGTLSSAGGKLVVSGLTTSTGGTLQTGSGNLSFDGGLLISGGTSSGFTVNSGGSASASSIVATGGGILIGGSSTTLTTLTVGSGGLTLTGQSITVNVATGAGSLGTRITLNGDFTASNGGGISLNSTTTTPVSGSVAELAIGSATRNFNILSGATNIYLSVTGAGGSLVKNGTGSLSLLRDNTYTGSTTVTGGTLFVTDTAGRLSGTSTLIVNGGGILQNGSPTAASNNGVTNRINSAATLALGGSAGSGTFTSAFAATTASQTLASLAIGQGANVINTTGTVGTPLSLIFTGTAGGAGYTRSVGGSVNITSASGFTVSITNAPTAAGGSSVIGSGSDAILIGATLGGTDLIAAQAGTLSAATYTNTGTTIWTAGKNMNVTGSVSATDAVAINSLRFGTSGAFTVSLAGMTTIDSGSILVSSGVGAFASAISGGTLRGSAGGDLLILQYNTGGDLTISSTIANNGSATALTKAGDGLVTLSGSNTYTGQTYLNGGTVSIATNAALGLASTGATLNFDGGILQTTASLALDNSGANARSLVLGAGGGTLQPTTGTLTVNGLISGTGALTKFGAGALLLNSANTYTGGTNLTTGTLQLGNNSALGTGTLNLSGGTLQASGSARTLSNAVLLKASSTISGSLGVTLSGTFTMNNGSFALTNSLSSGTLLISGPVYLTTGTATASRQFTVGGSGSTEISGVIADNDGTSTPVTGVTLNGTGTLRLSGVNTYTGRTVTANGVLVVSQDRNLGAVPTVATTDSVILAQSGTLRVDSSFTLNSNRSIGIGQTGGGTVTGTIDVTSGQTFTVAGKIADRTVNADGTSAGGTNYGTLAKTGAGTLVLQGANTYSGNTTVSAGTLVVSGSLNAASTDGAARVVSVSGGATLQLSGSGSMNASSLTLADTSTLSMEIAALTSTKITLTGSATLNGTIALSLALSADPTDGTTFTLIDGGATRLGSGLFSYSGTTLANNSTFTVVNNGFSQQFQINYSGGSDGNDVVLLAVPEPGAATMLLMAASLVGLSRIRRHPPRRHIA